LTKEEGTIPLTRYPNDGPEPPKVGDLIIYAKSSNSRWGHVAVVLNVNLDQGYVDIGE
jgi:hypothetical protein